MTIEALRSFPLDNLLQCSQCGAPMYLQTRPEPAYTCAGSTDQAEPCGAPALRAMDLNQHLLSQVLTVLITDSTFPAFRAEVGGALAIFGQELPEDEELHRNITSDPGWLMAAEQVVEAGAVLGRFIDRIQIRKGAALVEYRQPLPAGSPQAGRVRQDISLPESLLV